MKNKKELSYKQLKMICDPKSLKFKSTEELEPINTGIGQDRGIKALEFGLQIDIKGYNLYIEGPGGVGKTMYTKTYLEKISKKQKQPLDWCYVYNFDVPNEPIAISLTAGNGREFKLAMDGFIKEIKKDIKNTFNADDYEKEKKLIKQEFEEKRNLLLENLNHEASKYNFCVKSAKNGIYMTPIYKGKPIEEPEFEKLDENIKNEYEEKSIFVQEQIMQTIGKIKQIELASDAKISEWQSNIALLTVNAHINFIKNKFKRNKKINKFLNDVKQNVLANISTFLELDQDASPTSRT